ncbi:hypothetical protein BB560_000564 [Smittium megazygosporum]|uniref:Major facilitator superfamily (MFS) profile domain-containing protein n=1 Tax=Smittium megazygosporum TaxID=133381 RepID=A0A2T9ZK11_9FUNG|nr:hypothetical protein BB560_000564 [Smittium megazygosporum]
MDTSKDLQDGTEKMEVNKNFVMTEEEQRVYKTYLRKIDLRVLPIIFILYFASALDRSNIGAAMVNGVIETLHLSSTSQANVYSIFTVCYLVFEAPANMILKRWKPRYWFSFIVTCWSAATICLVATKTAFLFTFVRALVGTFEAGFTPVSGMVGGPIAGALTQREFLGLSKYQRIFFAEGLITLGIGILTFLLMHDYPDTAKFFTSEERILVTRRITVDQGLASKATISRKQTMKAFTDWKIYVFSFIYFGPNNCLGLLGYFGPTILKSMGYSTTASTYMAGIPYACGIVTMLIVLPFINRSKLYKICLVCFPTIIVGSILTAFLKKPEVRLFGLCLIGAGTCPAVPVGMTWMSTNAGSVSKRMISTAIFTTIGGLAGFFTPYMFTTKYAPNYLIGHIFNIVMQCVSLLCVLTLVTYFKKENARRDAYPEDISHLSMDEQQALNDKHPEFRYKL